MPTMPDITSPLNDLQLIPFLSLHILPHAVVSADELRRILLGADDGRPAKRPKLALDSKNIALEDLRTALKPTWTNGSWRHAEPCFLNGSDDSNNLIILAEVVFSILQNDTSCVGTNVFNPTRQIFATLLPDDKHIVLTISYQSTWNGPEPESAPSPPSSELFSQPKRPSFHHRPSSNLSASSSVGSSVGSAGTADSSKTSRNLHLGFGSSQVAVPVLQRSEQSLELLPVRERSDEGMRIDENAGSHPASGTHAAGADQPAEVLYTSAENEFYRFLGNSEMGRLIRDFNWANTELGPMTSWTPELISMISVTLASSVRCTLLVGPSAILIYNDLYMATAGSKHPELLGQPCSVGWRELWSELIPIVDNAMEGETMSFTDHFLAMERHGYTEETYHTFSYVPFRSADGTVIGIFNASFETTPRVIAERRLASIRDLVAVTNRARTIEECCRKTLSVLSYNPLDVPFAVLYTCEPVKSRSSRTKSTTSVNLQGDFPRRLRLTLQGAIGIPEEHPAAVKDVLVNLGSPPLLHTDSSGTTTSTISSSSSETQSSSGSEETVTKDGFQWPFAEAFLQRAPVLISDLDESGIEDLVARGWDEKPRSAVCLPIFAEADAKVPQAVLVSGINALGHWDDNCATFFQLLSRHIASGIAASQAVEQEARRAADLIALDHAKTAFVSNVSHELRTPLTLILGPLEDVLNGKGNLLDEDRQTLCNIWRHANRLLSMVNTLLDYSRLEGGKMEATYRPCLVSALTVDLASLFRAAIERGHVKLVVEAEPDPPEGKGKPVYLAEEMWTKVIFNLVGNAFKYTFSGEIRVRVRFTSAEVVVDVVDTGCGIADEEKDKIFDRFHRIDSTSRSHEGTGIGLALTLEIIKKMGGQIQVESQLGVGSTFTIRLPRGYDHLLSEHIRHDAAAGNALEAPTKRDLQYVEQAEAWRMEPSSDKVSLTSSSSASSESYCGSSDESFPMNNDVLRIRNSTVLIVDDNSDLRSYMASLLAKKFTVLQASDGIDALDVMAHKVPQLVITDIMMPRLDGYGLLKAIRESPTYQHLRVIVVSAKAGAEAGAELLENGADDYLVKPFQSRDFQARASQQLQLGKLRTELQRQVDSRTRELIESEMRYKELADRSSMRANTAEEHRKQLELFIDLFSHELRNPLSGVWQNAEVVGSSLQQLSDFLDKLATGYHPDDTHLQYLRREMQQNRDAVESILLCASHQGRIADDILNVSKLDMGLLTCNPIPFEFVPKIQEITRMFEIECQQKRITLGLQEMESLERLEAKWIVADPSRIAQILINFLTNAVKYTCDSGVRHITVRLEAHESVPPQRPNCMRVSHRELAPSELGEDAVWVSMAVIDSGRGLSDEEMTRLFARFSQVNPKTDQYGGSGLGLYVSKKVVELHDGFVEVESTSGAGSSFSFSIPAHRTKAPLKGELVDPRSAPRVVNKAIRQLKASRRIGSAQSVSEDQTRKKASHVLIVEDNSINQTVMQRQLKQQSFNTTVANNGREALNILKADHEKSDEESRIDFILMDIEMPVMDGLAAIRELREMERLGLIPRRFPAIAVTGNARQGQVDECLASGFDGTAIKPYRMKELLIQIDQVMNPP